MKTIIACLVSSILPVMVGAVNAQEVIGILSNNPYLIDSTSNPFGAGNKYNPKSINNPYGIYGSKYSPKSINNPYGAGSKFKIDSPTNPFGIGLQIIGSDN